jgi:hypothetical protein
MVEFKSESSSVNGEASIYGDVGGKTVEVSQLQTLKCRGQLLEQSPRRTRQVRLECGLSVSPSIRQAATARLAVDSRMLRRPCWWVDGIKVGLGIRPAIYTRIERLIHTRETAAANREVTRRIGVRLAASPF